MPNRHPRRAAVALACATLALTSAGARAQSPAADAPLPPGLLEDERNTIQLFRQCSRSVAFIVNAQTQRDIFSLNAVEVPRGSGSGFVWDDAGHVVTNFHVVEGADALTVTLADGKKYDATVVGTEQFKDLAVLQVKAPAASLVPLELGDSDHLLVGQKVLAIGNPFGLDQTLTTGVISALGREIKSVAGTTISDVIQTDASINPGNSGGPLLDSSGRLIGLNTAIFSPSGASAGIGFAVPVSTIRRVVPEILKYGHVRRAGFGVTLLPDTFSQRYGIEGIVIRDVDRKSAAGRAGLMGVSMDRWGNAKLGDVIVGIDGRTIRTYDDMYQALEKRRAGDHVKVQVLRNDATRDVEIILQELPN